MLPTVVLTQEQLSDMFTAVRVCRSATQTAST